MKTRSHWWWLLLVIPLGLGVWRLRFDADVLNLLPAELPTVRGLQLQQEHFASDRELILTVSARTAELAEEAAEALALALRRQTNHVAGAVWRPPWLDHPEDTAEFVAWLWLNQPPEDFAALALRLTPERVAAQLREVREQLATSMSPMDLGRLSYDPLGLTALPGAGPQVGLTEGEEWFASADGRFRVVFVDPTPAFRGFRPSAVWLKDIRRMVEEVRSQADWPAAVTVAFTGKPAFLAEAAGGMESDMRSSVLGTLLLVGAMVWLAHRRLAPKVWLLTCLVATLLITAALGGLIFGELNLVSLGFAAILLGLAVDFGLVLYQEASQEPGRPAADVRRVLAPDIWGSALTTAAAFLLLNFSGLPGLGQLGSLVVIGVLVGAVIMQYVFLPLATRGLAAQTLRQPVASTPARPSSSSVHTSFEDEDEGRERSGKSGAAAPVADHAEASAGRLKEPVSGSTRPHGVRWITVFVLGLAVIVLAWRGWPPVDHSTQALNPRNSAAEAAMKEMLRNFQRGENTLLLLVQGRDEAEVRARLQALQRKADAARGNLPLLKAELPLALWPTAEHQQANRAAAEQLAQQAGAFRAAILAAGFNEDAVHLAEKVFSTWRSFAREPGVAWPTSESSRWLLGRVVARWEDQCIAVGALSGVTDAEALRLTGDSAGVLVCGWQMLGAALLEHVAGRMVWLVGGMILLVALCLRLTLGGWGRVGLSFGSLAMGLLLLQAVMALAGWSWNLMNLPALPLLLGAGVDYSIHVLLSLRRHGADLRTMRRTTGRAVLLCAGTTIAAFGSLAFSSNAGLASLGQVCAAGVACVLVSTLYLMPALVYAPRR